MIHATSEMLTSEFRLFHYLFLFCKWQKFTFYIRIHTWIFIRIWTCLILFTLCLLSTSCLKCGCVLTLIQHVCLHMYFVGSCNFVFYVKHLWVKNVWHTLTFPTTHVTEIYSQNSERKLCPLICFCHRLFCLNYKYNRIANWNISHIKRAKFFEDLKERDLCLKSH